MKEDLPLKVIPYKEGTILQNDGMRVFFQTKDHIDLLKLYSRDAPEMYEKADLIKKPDHQNLIKFAKYYHEIICSGKCIIYEKEAFYIKTALEVLVGISTYNKDYFNSNLSYDFGAYLYFWLPRINESFHFKTGIIYSQLNNDEVKYIVKLPTQIFYQYTQYKLKPNLSFGINHYFLKEKQIEYFSTIAAGIGAGYTIANSLSLTCNYNTDFTSIGNAIGKGNSFGLITHSFNFGLKIDL